MGTAQTLFEEVVQGGATGNHMITRGPDRKWPEICSVHGRKCIPSFFSYNSSNTVVQVPWLPEVAEGHVTPFGVPLSVRMRNRKFRNIRTSGTFWPEVTLWNVTP